MGMAASQARLLTITARMHDIEYQAQSIQNAKIALATQSDEVYQEYLEALDAQTLTVKDWQGNVIAANFNNLCGINAVDSSYQYALINDKGQLIVSADVAKGYNAYMDSTGNQGDAYGFAYYMLGEFSDSSSENCDTYDDYQRELAKLMHDLGYDDILNGTDAETEIEEISEEDEEGITSKTKANPTKDADLCELLQLILDKCQDGGIDGVNGLNHTGKKELDALIDKFLFQINRRYSEDIFNNIFPDSKDEYNDKDFNYYVSVFKQIQANGGSCISIANCVNVSDYDGFDGDAANDGDWLRQMIQSGKITVDHVITDKKTGNVSFASTGVPSDSILEYTATSTIDSTALAKAEAEYEHKTKEIDRKDKKFDLDLSKLETQRTALKTEYESVKKVISENIDRTFGIFS